MRQLGRLVRKFTSDGVYLRTIGLVIGIVVIAAVVTTVVNRVNRNNEAIEKGCILLNNVIVESTKASNPGAQNSDPKKPKKPSSTQILVQAIVRNMTTEERAQYQQALERQKEQGNQPFIKLADCHKIAEHPDDIRAIPIKQ